MMILVTGGAGFVGGYVCSALLQRGHRVRVLDNLDPQVHRSGTDWPVYLVDNLEKVKGDIRDRSAMASALEGCDAVIHLASKVGVGQSMYEIEEYCSVNILGTAVLLEEVVKRKESIKKLIVASSMSIYGEGEYQNRTAHRVYPQPRSLPQLISGAWEVRDEDGSILSPLPTRETKPLSPQSIYATNKRDQEEMVLQIGRAYNIPAVALRMFNVYGPFQALSNPYTGVAAIFSSRLLNGNAPMIVEDGNQRRDFVNARDVAQAYCAVLESDAANGRSLNVGSGVSISIKEIAQTLQRVLGVQVEPVTTGKYRDGDIRHCFADISAIKKTVGWEPKVTFADGISELLVWLRTQSSSDNVNAAMDVLKLRGLLK